MRTLSLSMLFFSMLVWSCHHSPFNPNEKDTYTKGCEDFYLHKIISDSLIISINIDHKKIPFSTSFQTFPNIENEDFATIELEETCDGEAVMNNFCNDIWEPVSCESVFWKLKKGQLKFKVNRVLREYKCQDRYKATVILYDAEFVRDNTSEIRYFDVIEFKNVMVGYCAG